MSTSGKDQRKLVLALKKGDISAFEQFFYLYEKNLQYFVWSLTKSQYVAEEIVQEVFIKLWTRRETLDPSRSVKSLLYTMAHNLAFNHLRDAANRADLRQELWHNVVSAQNQTENTILSSEFESLVEEILESLPAQKRSIYILSRREGKSNQEIADLLGITPKTVKNHLWRTLQYIRERLQPYVDVAILLVVLLFFI